MEYLDFELAVDEALPGEIRVVVLHSPVGEARETARFPFDSDELRSRLLTLRETLIRARGTGIPHSLPKSQVDAGHTAAREFGRILYSVLLGGDVGGLYAASLREARRVNERGLRLKLRTAVPELAALPWELLYDGRRGDFLCLSKSTPLVRYLESPQPSEPLAVTPPLRILGMVASPTDHPTLDVEQEKQRMEEAMAENLENRLVEITWLKGQTWQALSKAMSRGGGGPWHIFHFIGHGGFDSGKNEGHLVLTGKDGKGYDLSALGLSRLLGDHQTMRLAVLNACEGAKGGACDLFSSTAAILVRRGLPAVVSMQHEISDWAAIEFGREFYRSLAVGNPVDAAVAEARKAVSFAVPESVEWATPVLHMRSPDGQLFRVGRTAEHKNVAPSVPPAPPSKSLWQRIPRRLKSIGAVILGILIGIYLLGVILTVVEDAPVVPATVGPDSVYFQAQVDRPAVAMPGPNDLDLSKDPRFSGVGGAALVQFVVDTSGRVDPLSIQVMRSTSAEFADAAKAEIAAARFAPAQIGDQKVKQLMQEEFSYKPRESASTSRDTVLFEDNFTSTHNVVEAGPEGPGCEAHYRNGGLVLRNSRTEPGTCFNGFEKVGFLRAPARIEITVKQLSGPSDRFYGLLFGNDNTSSYQLVVTDSGWVRVNWNQQGAIHTLDEARSDAVSRGQNVNRLAVEILGRTIRAFVNGKEVIRPIGAPTDVRGWVSGYVSEPGQEVLFDNLKVTKLSDSTGTK